ncbi:glutaminase family protein [Plebeiibacterium marinum]|uniref:DUF4965 domain-containing protein n=1 Tax=Plebeiibacterium marinum TaxID=2992111 RepID=A0AAE3SIC2_9BACT|nr:glutaminase family protein [Plebeiobacterium marinum]MCW3804457.1 DUF4965 domain-containing protein [Plebeiobacterium marinum]
MKLKKLIKHGLNGVVVFCTILSSCTMSSNKQASYTAEMRAPAYPLITIDPYTSAWSMSDQLFDIPVRHWTGKTQSLIGAIRVDGEVYRFLGKEDIPLKAIVPMASEGAWKAKYTTSKPSKNWFKSDFNDKSWKEGNGAFGNNGNQNAQTIWETEHIWVRREVSGVDLSGVSKVYLRYSHDDDFVLFLNGEEVLNTGNSARDNRIVEFDASLLKKDGNNVFAAYCQDRGGLAYLDFGIYVENDREQAFSKTAVQNKVALSATQTHYNFTCGPVDLDVRFISPLLPGDLDILSRPVNYVDYDVVSNDGKEHEVQVFFEMTPEWAVNSPSQEAEVTRGTINNLAYVKAGTTKQEILKRKGDNVRIDWGYAYLVAAADQDKTVGLGDYNGVKNDFKQKGMISSQLASKVTRPSQEMVSMFVCDNLGSVGLKPAQSTVMVAYDDVESIQYFGDNLKAWWAHDGEVSFDEVLTLAANDYVSVVEACNKLDNQVWNEALNAGGKNYAELCVLAFRQSIAAHKLVKDKQGNILFLSKENFSNGSIGTVDVTYPSAPLYLKYNPELLKGMLNPIFYYSESGKWTKPFAAHDVGTYPLANGQTYGGDMPVEECGNMLVLTAAIAHQERNADYAAKHWEVLTVWADYLLENGLDPENQLCTDDFAGHFAHNVNLSAKAIMGVASFGRLASMLNKNEIADKYMSAAKDMAAKWIEMAKDGDHYKLTFDKPGTWSQKYNLVWDKLLGFNIFPKDVIQTEIDYYLTKQNKYGLPLDNRRTYTKSDWVVWTATMANSNEEFQQFIDPLHLFVTETEDRVPMTDWYETPNARQVGFQARSVVGGYFIKLLE